MGIAVRIAEAIVAASKIAWRAADGKKTVTGAVITACGIGMALVPGLSEYAGEMLATGVPLLATGIIHKIHKNKTKKGEQNERERL